MNPKVTGVCKYRRVEIKKENFSSSEIGNPEILYKLANKEKALISFNTTVKTRKERGDFYFTIFSDLRRRSNLREGDIILLRIRYKHKTAIDIQKIHKWGKVNISKSLTDHFFNFRGLERVFIEIVKKAKILSKSNVISSKSFDLTSFFSKETYFIERSDDFITVWQSKRRSLTIPRYLKRDGEIFESLYLIWGDGSFIGKLYFSNKCVETHLKIISFFEKYLQIPPIFWRLRILFKDYSKKQDNIKKYWLSALNFIEEQLYPTISDSVLKTTYKGNGRIVLESSTVSELIRNLLDYINNNLTNFNTKEHLHMLNGILMAEGSIDVEKGVLHHISIIFNKSEEELFITLLKNLNLLSCFKKVREDKLRIGGWSNLYVFIKCFALDKVKIMNSHPKRAEKVHCFLNHKIIKSIYTYLKLLDEHSQMSVKDFVAILKYDSTSVCDFLLRSHNNFVNFEKDRRRYIFKLSTEGREFIETIKTLKNWSKHINMR